MDGMVPDYLIWIKVEAEGLNSSFRNVAVRLFRVVNKNHSKSHSRSGFVQLLP